MSKKLKAVVAGLGRIAWSFHLNNLKDDKRFELVAVSDPLQERVAETRKTFSVPRGYISYTEMLDAEKPDFAVIASPTNFHLGQVSEAFKRGIDVFCEKPIACTYKEAAEIAEEMKRTGRKLMVYQPHRITPPALALKKILADDVLGNIFMVRRVCADFRRRNDWQAKREFGGGMLNNYGAHFIDQFFHVFGCDFKEAKSLLRTVVSVGDAEDLVKALIVNRQNIILDLEINMASTYASDEWRVYGDYGTAAYDAGKKEWNVRYFEKSSFAELKLQEGMAAENRKYSSDTMPEAIEKIYAADTENIPSFYDYCYEYFADNKQPFVPVAETLEVMKAIESCR